MREKILKELCADIRQTVRQHAQARKIAEDWIVAGKLVWK